MENYNYDLKLPVEESSVVARERTLVSIVVAIVGEAGRGVGEDRLYRLGAVRAVPVVAELVAASAPTAVTSTNITQAFELQPYRVRSNIILSQVVTSKYRTE